jgi:lipopolysaccharide/colanic/teichoic acid biosynthesis glycosyltransferase
MAKRKKLNNYLVVKRCFDVLFAILGLVLLVSLILILFLLSFIDTKSIGFFSQVRISANANKFLIYKIRTHSSKDKGTISKFGNFLRRSKLDELPQLINILKGDMSFVGPRPDVPGYADKLIGSDRLILTVKPGLTGPASIVFRNEEYILKQKENPIEYNDTVIWPEKVRLNVKYVQDQSFKKDLYYLIKTVL